MLASGSLVPRASRAAREAAAPCGQGPALLRHRLLPAPRSAAERASSSGRPPPGTARRSCPLARGAEQGGHAPPARRTRTGVSSRLRARALRRRCPAAVVGSCGAGSEVGPARFSCAGSGGGEGGAPRGAPRSARVARLRPRSGSQAAGTIRAVEVFRRAACPPSLSGSSGLLGALVLVFPRHNTSHEVMAATLEQASFEEEQPPNEKETVTWKPGEVKPKILGQTKADECLPKNIPRVLDSDSEGSEFSDISAYEDGVSLHTDTDVEDLCGDISSMLEDVTFPRQQAASTYEVEDWDKELEESECNPYDAGDLYCGSFQENNLLASYSLREDSLYNPCCHHAACLAFTLPVRMTEVGQFDDADE